MGGMMGGGDTGSSQQTSKVELPPWVDAAAQSNYGMAQNIANKPYKAYGGPEVAGLAPEFYQAQGMLGNLDDYYGNYGGATDTFNRLTGFNARDVNAPTVTADMLKNTDLNPYLNPYIENVENRAVDTMTRSGQAAQNKIAADAAHGGSAFGSRQAVQQAVQGAETSRGIGDMSAQLRMQGYDKATANAMADLDRKLKAETQTGAWNMEGQRANQAADISGAGIQADAARGLTSTADAAQKAQMNEILQYLGIGQMSQAQTQKEYDNKKQRWEDRQNAPTEKLNLLLATLGMSPYGKTETTTKDSETKSGGGAAAMGGGFLEMLPAILALSDRSMKTDIEKLGVDPQTDLPIYAYRYKKDPKTYPKAVGVMAQDVEKKYPKAVRKIAGKRVVDLKMIADI